MGGEGALVRALIPRLSWLQGFGFPMGVVAFYLQVEKIALRLPLIPYYLNYLNPNASPGHLVPVFTTDLLAC